MGMDDILTKSLGLLNGLTSTASLGYRASQINRNPYFDYQMNALKNAGTYGYSNYNQILGEMNSLPVIDIGSYNDVRSMNGLQKTGSIASSALSGASAGMSFGPWGALAGGVLGGLWGGFNVWNGDEAAKAEMNHREYEFQQAVSDSPRNYEASIERVADDNHRDNAVHIAKKGGQIKRQMDIHEFASKVLGQGSTRYMPKKQYCKGGLKVSIKVK